MRFYALPLLALAALVSVGAAYRVLVVFPMPSRSHGILGDGVVSSLLQAGHDVTYITPFPKKDQPKQLQQVDASFMFDSMKHALNPFLMKEVMSFSLVKEFAYNFSTSLLKNDVVQDLMKDKTQSFDAVITEYFFSELYSGFAQVFQCPWILFSPIGMASQIEFLVDEVQSPAASPNFITGYTVPMSLKERIVSTFITFAGVLSAIYIDRPHDEPAYLQYYSPAAQVRGVPLQEFTAACHNISLVLANSHMSLSPATRLPPNAVEIGGYHIDPNTKPLPKDLQDLLDNSPQGLIYFSMGSNLNSSDMTAEMRRDLLQTFAGLKQKVLWKFEMELEGAPKNVHIRSWLPQQSLLAHKNLKIFITHGGLLSTTEAIYFGVPLIGIPVFGDQPINMQRAEKKGYALKVDLYSSQIGKDLNEAIQKMLGDPSYTRTAKRLSQLFHDRPIPPARVLSYWTEHVMRTGGAPHLRAAASSVPAYQRYLLDILALIVAALLLVFFIIRALIRFIFRRKPVEATSSKSKKKRN